MRAETSALYTGISDLIHFCLRGTSSFCLNLFGGDDVWLIFEANQPGEQSTEDKGDAYRQQEAKELWHVAFFEEDRQHGDAGQAVAPGHGIEGAGYRAADAARDATAQEGFFQTQRDAVNGWFGDAEQPGDASGKRNAFHLAAAGFQVHAKHAAGHREDGGSLQAGKGVVAQRCVVADRDRRNAPVDAQRNQRLPECTDEESGHGRAEVVKIVINAANRAANKIAYRPEDQQRHRYHNGDTKHRGKHVTYNARQHFSRQTWNV